MAKTLLILLLLSSTAYAYDWSVQPLQLGGEPVFGAPVFNVQRSLIPETTNLYYIGTTTPSTLSWAGLVLGFNDAGETRCLQITTGGVVGIASAACGSGSGSSSDLQDAYNLSAADAMVLLADAKDVIFSLADTATDPHFVISSAADSQGQLQMAVGSTTSATWDGYGRLAIATSTPGSGLSIATTSNLMSLTVEGTAKAGNIIATSSLAVATGTSAVTLAANGSVYFGSDLIVQTSAKVDELFIQSGTLESRAALAVTTTPSPTGQGQGMSFNPGDSLGANDGAEITFTGGSAGTSGVGGNINFFGGSGATDRQGGDILLTGGTGAGTGRTGVVGIASNTPYGVLSVEHYDTDNELFPAFVVSDAASSTAPSFVVLNSTGNVGVGTNTPGSMRIGIAGSGVVKGEFNIEATSTLSSLNATNTVQVATSTAGSGINLGVLGHTVLGGNLSVTGATDIQGTLSVGTIASTGGSLATTTFTGGVSAAGLASSQGLVVSAGDLHLTLGKAGIGTTTLGNRLEVAGGAVFKGNVNIEATSTASSFNATSTLSVGTSSPPFMFSVGVGNSLFGGNVSVMDMLFASTSLITKGKIGVATSSPYYGLSVGTTTVVNAGQFANSISSTTEASTYTINWETGNTQRLILNQNAGIIINATSSNPIDGGKYTLKICQDSVGSRTLTWNSYEQIRWWNGTTSISSGANLCTYIGMIYDGTYEIYSVVASSTGVSIK